jgi:hypothetical protein
VKDGRTYILFFVLVWWLLFVGVGWLLGKKKKKKKQQEEWKKRVEEEELGGFLGRLPAVQGWPAPTAKGRKQGKARGNGGEGGNGKAAFISFL